MTSNKGYLKPTAHTRGSRDFIDYDYVDKLPDGYKEWLGNFSKSYYRGGFFDGYDDAYSVKDNYNRNNRQNRDVYAKLSRSDIVMENLADISKKNDIAPKSTKIFSKEKPSYTTNKRNKSSS